MTSLVTQTNCFYSYYIYMHNSSKKGVLEAGKIRGKQPVPGHICHFVCGRVYRRQCSRSSPSTTPASRSSCAPWCSWCPPRSTRYTRSSTRHRTMQRITKVHGQFVAEFYQGLEWLKVLEETFSIPSEDGSEPDMLVVYPQQHKDSDD